MIGNLRKDIITYLSGKKAHVRTGNLDGEEAISFLHKELRDRRWRGLGSLGDFEDMLEGMGFYIRKVYRNNVRIRTYVGLPQN